MEEQDPIADKFKTSFSGFEKEPPAGVWEKIRQELHPDPGPGSFWTRFSAFTWFTNNPIVFYLSIGGIAMSLFVSTVYFGFRNHLTIRGHAYAGDIRLNGGSADLFRIADKTMPWDSATHYRSAIIDIYGHFQFSRIKNGSYLLRIAPDRNSVETEKFLPSWYDRYERSDSCNLIILQNADINVEAKLIKK